MITSIISDYVCLYIHHSNGMLYITIVSLASARRLARLVREGVQFPVVFVIIFTFSVYVTIYVGFGHIIVINIIVYLCMFLLLVGASLFAKRRATRTGRWATTCLVISHVC